MDINFKFSNLLGTVYRGGNVIFSNDGNSVISPVGNKISVFDLKNNVSRSLSFESSFNIMSIALNHCGTHLLVANEVGEIMYINVQTETIVHRFRAHRKINEMRFSPDSRLCAITRGGDLQIHEILPTSTNAFSPLCLKNTYKLCGEELISLDWSFDGTLIVAGGEDRVIRVVGSRPLRNTFVCTLASHKAEIICAQFFDGSYDVVSVDRRGLANCWTSNLKEDDIEEGQWRKEDCPKEEEEDDAALKMLHYEKNTKANLCDSSGGGRSVDVSSARFHPPSNMLVTAFANGVFTLHELPSFSLIHSLRVSHLNVSTVSISPSGDWLALGCGKSTQGQLVVWEWQSETYVMKQQSHHLVIRRAAFSPDGSLLATAGEDGMVKVWNGRTSFCIVSFDEHTAAATGVTWTQSGKAIVSCSLDGTVRAHDIKKYRNFRTLVSPDPTPLACVVVDSTGDIVVAAAAELFQIFVWSMENGQLLDVLSGHAATISSLAIKGNALASVSWDKTLRMWNIVDSSCESVDFSAEGVAVAMAPSLPLVAVLTLDGQIAFLETESLTQAGSIEAGFDLDAGRGVHDKIKKDTSERSKSWTSISFSPDSSLLLVGGQTNFFCLYSVEDHLLLRKFTMTVNRSLDGVVLDISRRNYTEFGNMKLVDTSESEEEGDGRKAIKLAGTKNADKGERRARPEAVVHDVAFCPTGRRFVVCSTEGVQVYCRDAQAAFDPFQLDEKMSNGEVTRLLAEEEFPRALKGALQLGDSDLIRRCVEEPPVSHISLISSSLSVQYTERLLKWMADVRGFVATSHLQLYLKWVYCLMSDHGAALKERKAIALLTSLQQTVQHFSQLLTNLTTQNTHSIGYLLAARKLKAPRNKDSAMEED